MKRSTMKGLDAIAVIVIGVLAFVGVRRVWGAAVSLRALVTYFLFGGAVFVWEYKRHRRWEYLAWAAYAILFSAAFGAPILAGEPHGGYDERYVTVHIVLVFAGFACAWAGIIGHCGRISREKAVPIIPEENSEGA